MVDPAARPAPPLPEGLRALRQLGDSPTSEVWLVEDAQARPFALKILRASVARDERVRERWQREAELLGELDHPNLVRCHGAFEVAGRPALLLDFIEGPTLREVLRDGPLAWEQSARYGVQVARALGKLHRHGAVHRDVKPHNVLVDPRRGAVLADLGLVRRDEDPTLTRQGTALGSPAYMSPEQARDPSRVDAQADVYSLGATLHHALSGRPPFLGAGVGEVIHRVMHDDPEPLPEHVPDALRRVLLTSLAKDLDRRYARAEDFGGDLGRVLLGYPPRLLTRRRRRLRLRAAWSLGGLAAAGLIAILAWPGDPLGAAPEPRLAGEAAEAPGAAATPGGREGDPAPEAPAAPDPDLGPRAFEQWCQPYALRLRSALDGGRWRDARAEIEAVRDARVPEGAPLGWRPAKLAWLQSSGGTLQAAVERAAGRALEILDQETSLARGAIALGSFEAAEWEAAVQDQWRAAGLRLDGLPLQPGGHDPAGRLRMTRLSLERQSEQERLRLALAALPGLRDSAAALLRTGDFLAARRLWENAEPALFEHAREARFELARTDELLALQRRLEARLRERVGSSLLLELREGGRLEGTVVAGAEGYALDYRGQSRVPVELLLLDPEFALDWLNGSPQAWLTAQLEWCQDKVERALQRVESLDAAALPAEWAPAFWSVEWRREAAAALEVVSGDAAPVPSEPPPGAIGVEGARADLLDALRRRFPRAELTLRGEAVEIAFAEVDLAAGWSLDLRSELRNWRLARWELSWRLGIAADPPRRVRWLEEVELLAPVGAVPQVTLDGRSHPGFGILAGQGWQTMIWEDGAVRLDGVQVGPCPAPRRGILTASADADFSLTWIRLSLLPR